MELDSIRCMGCENPLFSPRHMPSTIKTHTNCEFVWGSALNASEPGIPLLTGFSAETLDESSESQPSFRIQFSGQQPDSGHTLTFRDPLLNKINTQPFSNVAYIALGQWMRRMGDPILKVKAPYTGNIPVSWTISISPEQKMTLAWIME